MPIQENNEKNSNSVRHAQKSAMTPFGTDEDVKNLDRLSIINVNARYELLNVNQ